MRAPRKVKVPQQVLAVAKKATGPSKVAEKPVAAKNTAKTKVIAALKRLHPMD